MYVYIYDEILQDNRHEKELSTIEQRLTDLDISGKVLRLWLFHDLRRAIEREIQQGASTIVLVGSSKPLQPILDLVIQHQLPLGIIPIGQDDPLSMLLGVERGMHACDVLSARNLEKIDTGSVNNQFFIRNVCAKHKDLSFGSEDAYTVKLKDGGQFEICNAHDTESCPVDGQLEACFIVNEKQGVFKKDGTHKTKLYFEQGSLSFPEDSEILIDDLEYKGNNFSIQVHPKSLSVIVGREKGF